MIVADVVVLNRIVEKGGTWKCWGGQFGIFSSFELDKFNALCRVNGKELLVIRLSKDPRICWVAMIDGVIEEWAVYEGSDRIEVEDTKYLYDIMGSAGLVTGVNKVF